MHTERHAGKRPRGHRPGASDSCLQGQHWTFGIFIHKDVDQVVQQPLDGQVIAKIWKEPRCPSVGDWIALTGEAQRVERSPFRRSGHMLGLQVWFQVRGSTEGSPLMFLSHIDVSVPLCLPSSSLSKMKNKSNKNKNANGI